MKKYERLSRPIEVGGMTLKNRIIMTAMHHLYTENGHPTPRFNEYFWQRAEGGAAMVVVGACRFDDYGARASTMSLRSDSDIEPYKEFTAGMKARDCKIAVQLYHAGRYMFKEDVIADDEAIAPSAVFNNYTRETAREMTRDDITRVIRDWAAAAARAQAAGFDAVEISGSAGYLISQFLSPLANKRTDEYGGTFRRRCRFPLEVIEEVRGAVGSDYPVLLRLGGHDLVPGSSGSDESVRFARLAASAGVDMIDLTGGWHESRVPQLTGEMPRGGLVHLAQAIKDAVNIPVSMANRMGNPDTAEKAIALGCADLISVGRPLIADPQLPNKIFAGKPETIRHCVSCNQGCLANTFFDRPIKCLANPLAGRELIIRPEPVREKKKILVVGGGPAGCEFAVRAADRGHEVSLWERDQGLGGQMKLAGALPARCEFLELIKFYERALADAGVDISPGREAKPEEILRAGFDEAVFATGRKYGQFKVPVNTGKIPVYSFDQIIRGEAITGKRVAVIGGGFIGLETARMLAMDGSLSPQQLFYLMRYQVEKPQRLSEMLNDSRRKVAVFEKGRLGAGYESGVAWPVLGDLKKLRAELYKQTRVLEISDEGVVMADFVWPCDAVVFTTGTSPEDTLYHSLKDKMSCHLVGNASKLGRAISAIEAAAQLGCSI